ncbi:WD repeat-containing protein 66 [Hypsibius exemplaris]|uniref:Cilia- and flagella-associated protein 251 n=1 Tax=Hypsibius exemplaris TaxID=2072580 RepID=A0A1W0W8Y3_HYPEX|nr:WD repeat-containing protein 66 [Hypsibius exemplaris]
MSSPYSPHSPARILPHNAHTPRREDDRLTPPTAKSDRSVSPVKPEACQGKRNNFGVQCAVCSAPAPHSGHAPRREDDRLTPPTAESDRSVSPVKPEACQGKGKNFGVQCAVRSAPAQSAFYADRHKEPYLTILNSLENFPPVPPLNPVPDGVLKELLVSRDQHHRRNNAETESLMREFKTTPPTLLPLKLEWTFGINRHVPFVNLSTDSQKSIFYSVGHTAVVYSYEHDGVAIEPTQILLEGLDRQITCLATTKNGRWLAAGDTGPDYAAIVWDLQQDAVPMRIYSRPNGKEAYGLTSMCFSPNMRFLAMLSSGEKQILTLYEWLVDRKGKDEGDTPVACYQLPDGETLQTQLSFNPLDQEMLISCSKERAILYQWHVARTKGQVRICVPNTEKVPSFSPIGDITRAVFIPAVSHFVIGTVTGLVALFRKRTTHKKVLPFEEYAEVVKVSRVVESGSVTALTSLNGMIVVGDSTGSVGFYDCNLLILYTCLGIGKGAIDTISFARMRIHRELTTKFENKTLFDCAFMVGTSTGFVVDIRTTGDDHYESKVVREEPRDTVISCAVHPNAYRLILGSACGLLRVWDYKHKTVVVQRRFGQEGAGDAAERDITCLAFDPTGIYVAVGFASGDLRLVKTVDLVEEPSGSFCDSFGKILFMEFSNDGTKLATAVEYDLEHSGNGDLLIIYRELADQESQTSAFAYYPPIGKESFLITANDKYKLKLWNVTTKMCRKTVNGPLQGSPLMGMTALPIRDGNSNRYLLWRNADSVGLMALPLDGNPYRYCSRRVHPLGDILPLQELPNLFCALSFYPSDRERKDVINEVKYSKYAETGLLVSSVDVGTALKTFVNHRPIWGIQYPELLKAFAKFGFEELLTTIKPPQLVQILKGIGESMTEEEAIKTLGVLLNLRPPLGDWETVGAERDYYNSQMTLPKELTIREVIEKVLAFQTKDAFYGGRDPTNT